MDAGDTAAVVVAVASAIAVAVLVVAVLSLTKAAAELRRTAEDLRRETLPVVAELRQMVSSADAELERVDHLIGTAENVTATVDSASRLAYLALSNPVIKALAFASGTGRAARRFRKGRDDVRAERVRQGRWRERQLARRRWVRGAAPRED